MVIQVVMTKTLSAAEFKATCLEVLDQVARTGRGVVVTKRGKPVAGVVPLVNRPDDIVGAMKGTVEIRGDIISPLTVRWEAFRG
jgi:prevent-host-death family protein